MKKVLAMIAVMLPMVVMAQDKKDTTFVLPQGQQAIVVAAELSKYGYANNDALSLIQAARMSKQAGLTEEAREKGEAGGKQSDASDKSNGGQVSLDPTKLLADAATMAGGDGTLLALIDDVKGGVRGAVNGPKYASDRVLAYDTDYYTVRFRGGEEAIVIVIGDGDTDLDLYIYDSNGNLVDSDTDYTDNCVCTWYPRWTDNFRIKIVNRGSVYNRYVLNTN